MESSMLQAAGILFYSLSTKRFLFLLRNNTRTKNTWGLVGGKINSNENIADGLQRECLEEIGNIPQILKQIPLETFTSMDEEFKYYSFIFVVANEFIPILNSEHCGYAWSDIEKYPKPLHPGVFSSINTEVILEKIKLCQEIYSTKT
jgi:8-oxo-dGTP pyrophosphatase MutT (NUDIX family)